MREITIFNPAAGNGKGTERKPDYITTGVGDCRRFVAQACKEDPETHFFVCGGDGTLNEAVSGIIDAGAGQTALVTAVPCGSGNDTVKTTDLNEKGTVLNVDLIRCNDAYSINMINIGFDCNVVDAAASCKKKLKISGKLSYLLGVGREFFKPFGEHFKVHGECVDGSTFDYDAPAILCAVCNGQWCGGGFHNSPLSEMTDGELEVVLARKMSRLSFIALIGKYKKGTLIDRESCAPIEKYKEKLIYKKVKTLTLTGCRRICSDGEIFEADRAEISVIPHAIRYVV